MSIKIERKRKYSQELEEVSKVIKIEPTSLSLSPHSTETDFEPLNESYAINFFNNLKQNLSKIPHDLTFLLANGKQASAHKIIMINSSTYFSNLIPKKCLLNSEMFYVNLPQVIDYKSFQFCVNFAQTGRLGQVQNESLYDLKSMAMSLQMHDLVDQLSILIEKFELDASYSNFRAILSNLYTNMNQSCLNQEKKFDCLKQLVNTTDSFVLDTINRDFIIREKYIYNSQLVDDQSLDYFFENYKLLRSMELNEEMDEKFNRNSLVIFSVDTTGANYVLKTKLNFTDSSVLCAAIKDLYENFLSELTQRKFRLQINRVCYLKKPSNCKNIKLETIKTSTDCFRAIVEYSRHNSNNELPLVLVTCHVSVNF